MRGGTERSKAVRPAPGTVHLAVQAVPPSSVESGARLEPGLGPGRGEPGPDRCGTVSCHPPSSSRAPGYMFHDSHVPGPGRGGLCTTTTAAPIRSDAVENKRRSHAQLSLLVLGPSDDARGHWLRGAPSFAFEQRQPPPGPPRRLPRGPAGLRPDPLIDVRPGLTSGRRSTRVGTPSAPIIWRDRAGPPSRARSASGARDRCQDHSVGLSSDLVPESASMT